MRIKSKQYNFGKKLKDQGFMTINDWKKFENLIKMHGQTLTGHDNVDTSGMSEKMKTKIINMRITDQELRINSKKLMDDFSQIFSYFSDEELNHPYPIELFILEKIELVSKMTDINVERVYELFSIFNKKHDFILSKGNYKGRGYLDNFDKYWKF